MFDIRWIRENPGAFDAGLVRRGLDPQSGAVLKLDEVRRSVLTRLQEAQSRRNSASKEIGRAKGSGDNARAQALIDEVGELKRVIQADEEAARTAEARLDALLEGLPNLPAPDVPDGADESANVERHTSGSTREFDFEPRQHFEIGEALGLMDFETAARLSGARFVVLSGALARLERAIAQFMLDLHTGEFGYREVSPPLLVRDGAMFGTGQLPKFADDLFATWRRGEKGRAGDPAEEGSASSSAAERAQPSGDAPAAGDTNAPQDRLWLIPTAEVSLTNLVRESIIEESRLPMRVTAHTPCFRAEAGAAGRDTRGMIRQHQFSKVELVSITTPDRSGDELERMLGCAEAVLQRLDLPYRVVVLSTGDMGFSAQKTYDIEVWLPGQGTYREISSCSLCGDFQARRMNARYRPADGSAPRFVHTLNGSGLAVGRTLVAVLENYQEADGTVRVPDALAPYMGGLETIGPLEECPN